MMSFLFRHLLESTFFCLLLSAFACCLRKGATVRHAVLFTGAAKFAIPTVLLAKTGGELAFLWPAASWLTSMAGRISLAFTALLRVLPADGSPDLIAVWAAGTALMIGLWVHRIRRNQLLLQLPSEQEQAALAEACAALGIRLPVRLRCTSEAIEPALRGILRPTISVPKGLIDRLSPTEFEAVLLHELAHARRFDNLTAALVHALLCVFWFHPLLWLVERRLNVERERACDETVVACGMNPQIYAAGILKVCRFQLFAPMPGASAITGADLKRRLALILDEPAPAAGLLYVPWLLVAGLAMFMAFVPIAGGYCEQCGSSGQINKGEIKK